ncbi:hypothetical protein AML91_19990 [Paenibacillus jilunlii]|uniref:Uncharacterized protein n=1 Tax=Paenibacillus jilunlii TaxID=682956 RepID=A0ABR5SRQ6_9BACL|nr:hypothetical protein AML91_19990 [Paenibacillus jilunlii]
MICEHAYNTPATTFIEAAFPGEVWITSFYTGENIFLSLERGHSGLFPVYRGGNPFINEQTARKRGEDA